MLDRIGQPGRHVTCGEQYRRVVVTCFGRLPVEVTTPSRLRTPRNNKDFLRASTTLSLVTGNSDFLADRSEVSGHCPPHTISAREDP